MHIQPHSQALEERGGTSPALFENRKKYPDFGKKDPDCAHLCVKLSIQNVVLRVSRRKKSKKCPCRPLVLVFLTKYLSKCPISNPLPSFFQNAPS